MLAYPDNQNEKSKNWEYCELCVSTILVTFKTIILQIITVPGIQVSNQRTGDQHVYSHDDGPD